MNKNAKPNINLTFIRGGSSCVGKAGTFGEHWCAYNKVSYENKFYLPTCGTGELFIGGKSYKLEKYKWFLIGEGEPRSYYTTNENELENHVVHFYADTGAKTLKEEFDLPDFIELDEAEYKNALSLMEKINHTNPLAPAELYEVFSNKSKVYNILSYYIELAQRKNLHKSYHDDEDSHIRYMILEYIKNSDLKNIKSVELAQALGMNENYFLKYFKKLFSITLHQLVFKRRMLIAFWRLADSPYTVKEIAESCGFESLSHFIKTFKSQTGMTPLVFRNNYLNAPVSSGSEIIRNQSIKH